MKYTILALLLCSMSAWAVDGDTYYDIGDISAETLLTRYLEQPDKNAADDQMVKWIDAWTDGFLSVYAYERLLKQDAYTRLTECVMSLTPVETWHALLRAARHPELREETVSILVYYGIRSRCKEVLGPMPSETNTGDSTS